MDKLANQDWHKTLRDKYDKLDIKDLPEPSKGGFLSLEESEYRVYYVRRLNRNRIEPEASIGKVYLISDNTSQVKIGISKDVAGRFRNLCTGSGRHLTLVTTYTPKHVKYATLERLLHHHYREYRKLGEWFEMEITEEEFLDTCIRLDNKK